MKRSLKLMAVAVIMVLGSFVSYGQTAEQLTKKGDDLVYATKYTEAVKLYRQAAEQGDEYAQKMLGSCYFYGLGVEKNKKKAIELFKATGASEEEIEDFLREVSNTL